MTLGRFHEIFVKILQNSVGFRKILRTSMNFFKILQDIVKFCEKTSQDLAKSTKILQHLERFWKNSSKSARFSQILQYFAKSDWESHTHEFNDIINLVISLLVHMEKPMSSWFQKTLKSITGETEPFTERIWPYFENPEASIFEDCTYS